MLCQGQPKGTGTQSGIQIEHFNGPTAKCSTETRVTFWAGTDQSIAAVIIRRNAGKRYEAALPRSEQSLLSLPTLVLFRGAVSGKLLKDRAQGEWSFPNNCNTLLLFVGCQQHASVSQEQICSDRFMHCHTETEITDQTFYLTQSQYTDAGSTCPSTDPTMPGAWQGCHWRENFLSH